MKLNKDDIYGIVGTVIFHLGLFLILWFTVMKTVVPDEDGGILVNFGNVDAASGTFEPKYTGQELPQETTTPPPPEPAPKVEAPKEELITQDVEESVREDMELLKASPLIPEDVVISGAVYDVDTGLISEVK